MGSSTTGGVRTDGSTAEREGVCCGDWGWGGGVDESGWGGKSDVRSVLGVKGEKGVEMWTNNR